MYPQNLPRRRSAVCGGPCRVCGECAARKTGSHCPGKRVACVAMQDFQTVTAYKGAPFVGGKRGYLRESACQKRGKRIARQKPDMKNALRMRRGALRREGRAKRITERCGERRFRCGAGIALAYGLGRAVTNERGGAQAKGTEGDVRRDIGKACPQGKEHCGGRE